MKNLGKVINFITSHPLTTNKIVSVKKFLYWQLSQIILPKRCVIEWIDNAKLIIGKGEAGTTGNYYVGLMEFKDMGFLLHYLNENDTFIDIGANAGVYTILAGKVKNCSCIAFEPSSDSYFRLLENVNLNGITERVTIKKNAVGASIRQTYFTKGKDTINRIESEYLEGSTTPVSLISLDEYLKDDDSGENDYVIKCDVEGYEWEVLKGAKKLIEENRIAAIILEINGSQKKYDVDERKINNFLREAGYTPIHYNPIKREITRIDGHDKINGNTIYVRNTHATMTRIEYSEAHTIHSANAYSL